MLLGRVTFTEWAGYWPTSTDEPFASWIKSTPKYVASSTLDSVDDWANSTLITGSVPEFVADLKRQDGGTIGTAGSPTLVRTLIEHGLVDELTLMISPVVAGGGRALCSRRRGAAELRARRGPADEQRDRDRQLSPRRLGGPPPVARSWRRGPGRTPASPCRGCPPLRRDGREQRHRRATTARWIAAARQRDRGGDRRGSGRRQVVRWRPTPGCRPSVSGPEVAEDRPSAYRLSRKTSEHGVSGSPRSRRRR